MAGSLWRSGGMTIDAKVGMLENNDTYSILGGQNRGG